MKIYNETKTEILLNPDLEKGRLIQDKIVIKTIPAQQEVQEQFHYEYKEYPNGGKDQIKVVDVNYRPAKPETYEYEDIEVYVPYTDKELARIEIGKLKQELEKWKEDVEQVELFGMERVDYEQKKTRCAEIIIQLRELEKMVADE